MMGINKFKSKQRKTSLIRSLKEKYFIYSILESLNFQSATFFLPQKRMCEENNRYGNLEYPSGQILANPTVH